MEYDQCITVVLNHYSTNTVTIPNSTLNLLYRARSEGVDAESEQRDKLCAICRAAAALHMSSSTSGGGSSSVEAAINEFK
jgi:hypothetical protein